MKVANDKLKFSHWGVLFKRFKTLFGQEETMPNYTKKLTPSGFLIQTREYYGHDYGDEAVKHFWAFIGWTDKAHVGNARRLCAQGGG